MLSAIRLPPAPLVKAASRGAAACITTPVPRAAAAALSTAAAGFVASKAPKRAQVAPPTLPEPALDAFLSPSGAVLVPSFGALPFPTFGGVRSRIERNYERSSLLIWPRRSRSTSASGPPSGTEAKAPAATVNPSAEDDRALIDRLPEALRKSFGFTWKSTGLRHYLLKELSEYQRFNEAKINSVNRLLDVFADVPQFDIKKRCPELRNEVSDKSLVVDDPQMAISMIGWIQEWEGQLAPAEAAARPRAELSANQVADLEASLASAPALPVGADPIQSRFDALMSARVLKHAGCNFTPILLPNENQYQDEGILSMLKDHYKQVFTLPPGNPKQFPLGIVAGIPGIGKTRASLEYVRHAVQMTQASGHATTVVPIYVTYNSTTPFGSLDRVLGAGLSIAYRVLLSYINADNFWTLPKVQEVVAAIGRVTLSEVLGIIAMHAMQYPPNLVQLQVAAAGSSSSSSSSSPALTTANPPRVMFVLILDEFQRALIHEGVAPEPRDPVSKKIDSPFLQSIVEAMATCSIRSISQQTWHCTALFAGLTFVPLEELIRGSSHSLTRFPVPCLTFGQSVAYVKYYMETQRPTSWPQDFDITQDAVFQRVLMYASGHARSLEAICATLSTNAFVTYVASSNSKSLNASDAELFVKAIGSALENRVGSLNVQQIESTLVSALRCAVLVNPVVKDDSGHNLVEANSLGTIVESRLVLPMLIGYALVSRLERLYAQQAPSQPLPRHWRALKTLLDKSVPGEQYSLSLESACAAALALRLYSFALEYGSDVIPLKQLHQGARFADNSSIAHLEIPKPDPNSIELCDRGGKLGPFLPNCRLPGTVYHGMINNAAVDFYTFHEKLPDQDFQVVQAGDAKLYESTVYSKEDQAKLVENSSKALASADPDDSDASDAKSKYKLALSVFADGRVSIATKSLAKNVFFVDRSNFRKYFPPLLWPMFDGLSTMEYIKDQEQKAAQAAATPMLGADGSTP